MSNGGMYVDEALMDEIRSLGGTVASAEEKMKAFQDYMRAGLSSLTFDSAHLHLLESVNHDIGEFIQAKHLEMRKTMQRVLPITIVVNGEKRIVGEALLETDSGGDHIMHAVIDADEEVTKILNVGLNDISIGCKADYKKET